MEVHEIFYFKAQSFYVQVCIFRWVKFSGAEYNTESQEIVITGWIIGISRGIWAGRVSYVELGKIGRCSLANWGTQTCNLMGLLSPTNEAEYLDWRAGCSLFQAGHQMSAVMVRWWYLWSDWTMIDIQDIWYSKLLHPAIWSCEAPKPDIWSTNKWNVRQNTCHLIRDESKSIEKTLNDTGTHFPSLHNI